MANGSGKKVLQYWSQKKTLQRQRQCQLRARSQWRDRLEGVELSRQTKLRLRQARPEHEVHMPWGSGFRQSRVLQEYLIQVFPKYDKDKVSDGVCGGDVRHEKEFGVVSFGGNVTQAWLNNLLPATAYDVTVSAKTRHKEAGEYQYVPMIAILYT